MKWLIKLFNLIRRWFKKKTVESKIEDVEPMVKESISLEEALKMWKKENGS